MVKAATGFLFIAICLILSTSAQAQSNPSGTDVQIPPAMWVAIAGALIALGVNLQQIRQLRIDQTAHVQSQQTIETERQKWCATVNDKLVDIENVLGMRKWSRRPLIQDEDRKP